MPQVLSRKILIQKLKGLGFIGPFSDTRHQYLKKDKHKVFIPFNWKDYEISWCFLKGMEYPLVFCKSILC